LLSADCVRRLQAIVLLAMVLAVPALARAAQHVTFASTAAETSGYSTSADSAPERVVVSPNVEVAIFDPSDATPPVQPAWVATRTDERLPSPPVFSAVRALRAPPSPASN
jgi:hypothetical protein